MKVIFIVINLFIAQILVAQERMTNFDPEKHGFKFTNSFTNDFIKEFDMKTGGLCGGMVYSALDYFLSRKQIPQQKYRPTVHSELHDYIYERQLNSFIPNLDKWAELTVNPFGARNDEFFKWGLQGYNGGRIEELREIIDSGRPAPLGLWHFDDASGGDHQVLAIGYKMGRYKGDLGKYIDDFSIYIYDPNYPGETKILKADIKSGSFYYVGGSKKWLTYFVDKKYKKSNPPLTKNATQISDGLIRKLRFSITTGTDDLRGGNDNLNIQVNYINKPSKLFKNVNHSRRWIDNYTQTFELTLDRPVKKSDISNIVLKTNFSGGFNSENWNVKKLEICAVINNKEQVLFQKSGKSGKLHRFTDKNKFYSATINNVFTAKKIIRFDLNQAININRCYAALQGKVAVNYKGNKKWSKANLEKMCPLNNKTNQPARCFQKVMHGNVSWGGGTKWQYGNVLNLCKGTLNANKTINCFKKKIKNGSNWSQAINTCKVK